MLFKLFAEDGNGDLLKEESDKEKHNLNSSFAFRSQVQIVRFHKYFSLSLNPPRKSILSIQYCLMHSHCIVLARSALALSFCRCCCLCLRRRRSTQLSLLLALLLRFQTFCQKAALWSLSLLFNYTDSDCSRHLSAPFILLAASKAIMLSKSSLKQGDHISIN